MGKPPRSLKPHIQRPSPLQQVHLTRPLSHVPPTSGLVRDPNFWKRFSTAVHLDEVPLGDVEKGSKSSRKSSKSSNGGVGKEGNEWLAQQAKEKRHCRVICISITLVVMLVIVAGALCGWYLRMIHKI